MEVGELNIRGSLDTSNIVRGQRAINVGFENMKQKTQSSFASMDLLAGSAARLGSALSVVATAAVGGLTLLAGLTPMLAPEFAKIKVETFKLAQIFGKEMKPALEEVTDAYSSFVSFLSQDTGLANFTKDTLLLVGAGGALSILSSKLFGFKNLGKIVIPLVLSYEIVKNQEAIADFGKDTGKSLAGSLGASEGGFIEGAAGNTGALISSAGAGAIAGALIGAMFGPGGAGIGGGIGAVGGFSYEFYNLMREEYFNNIESGGR